MIRCRWLSIVSISSSTWCHLVVLIIKWCNQHQYQHPDQQPMTFDRNILKRAIRHIVPVITARVKYSQVTTIINKTSVICINNTNMINKTTTRMNTGMNTIPSIRHSIVPAYNHSSIYSFIRSIVPSFHQFVTIIQDHPSFVHRSFVRSKIRVEVIAQNFRNITSFWVEVVASLTPTTTTTTTTQGVVFAFYVVTAIRIRY
jgi:hypothetical protein